MDRIRELEAALDTKRGELKALVEAARRDKRAFTDEEKQKGDALNSEVELIGATLAVERQAVEWDRATADPIPGATVKRGDVAFKGKLSKAEEENILGETLVAVAKATKREQLSEREQTLIAGPSGANTTVPSEGGFLVRKDVSNILMDRVMVESSLAQRCWVVEVGPDADGIEWPLIKETSGATGSRFGGVRVYRRGEGDTVTASAPKFDRFELRLEDLMGLSYASERALRDASSLGSVISRSFGREGAFVLDDEIVRGTGVGQCQGILTAPALVTVSKKAAQTATTLVAENMVAMYSRMPGKLRTGAAWFHNQDVEPQLFTQTIGSYTAAFMPPGGLSGSPYATFLGAPLIPIPQCETMGTKGDIFFNAMSEYVLIKKGGVRMDESMHVRFIYGENTFRFQWSVNGAPAWKASWTPYKGSANQSPFVCVETRS
jgi:HK97 family phage major capsid protein